MSRDGTIESLGVYRPLHVAGVFRYLPERKSNSIWMVTGYGKVLARPSMLLIEREFVALRALAAGGCVRQLESHVKGIVNLEMRTLSNVFRKIEGIIPIALLTEVGRIIAAARFA